MGKPPITCVPIKIRTIADRHQKRCVCECRLRLFSTLWTPRADLMQIQIRNGSRINCKVFNLIGKSFHIHVSTNKKSKKLNQLRSIDEYEWNSRRSHVLNETSEAIAISHAEFQGTKHIMRFNWNIYVTRIETSIELIEKICLDCHICAGTLCQIDEHMNKWVVVFALATYQQEKAWPASYCALAIEGMRNASRNGVSAVFLITHY